MRSRSFGFEFQCLAFVLIFLASAVCVASQKPSVNSDPTFQNVRSTPAYAEVLLRTTQMTAELEALLVDYTEDYPRIKDLRMELSILKEETDRLNSVKPSETGRLTLALGKLIIGKVEHAVSLKRLQGSFQDNHPNVKREKKQVEVFEAAIKEILN